MRRDRVYLALGDSMSIDDYTDRIGGGAASQFARMLGNGWTFADRTCDGCRMADVPRDGRGDVVTLTIGGNDLLYYRDRYLREGLDEFAHEHLSLLTEVRSANRTALFIVGDIYAPAFPLTLAEQTGLAEANLAIRRNCEVAGAVLAPIHDTFGGHESAYLCLGIEPTLAGASAIAQLFRRVFDTNWQTPS